MKTHIEKQWVYKETVSCICNKCGKEMIVNFGNICGAEVYVEGSYDSPCLEDCTSYEFDLCEYCLTELMDAFIYPAKKTEHGV